MLPVDPLSYYLATLWKRLVHWGTREESGPRMNDEEEEGMGIEHVSLKPYIVFGAIVTLASIYIILAIVRVV